MVRMSPFDRSSFVDDIAIWLDGGGVALALFIRVPSSVGEPVRLDILGTVMVQVKSYSSLRV